MKWFMLFLATSAFLTGCGNLVTDSGVKKAIKLNSMRSSITSAAAGDASSVQVKVYNIGLSTESNCDNLIPFFTQSGAGFVEVAGTASTTLGSGSIDEGTYRCLAVEISDQILVTAGYTSGACSNGNTGVFDICNNNLSYRKFGTDAGTSATCTTAVENKVTLYFTTDSTNINTPLCAGSAALTACNPFRAPADDIPQFGHKLPAPIVIGETSTLTLHVNQVAALLPSSSCNLITGFPGITVTID